MKRSYLSVLAALAFLAAGTSLAAAAAGTAGLRPPAIPLVTHDPYFSIWAVKDKLTDDWPRHWTGAVHGLSALVRVDVKPYRVMGPEPENVPALKQTGLEVTPTQTTYSFADAGVELRLTFTSPLLIKDLDIMSRPATYVTASIRATDGSGHAVSFFFDAPASLAVNTRDQKVVWGRSHVPGLEVMGIGSKDQPVLEKKGDDLRIDWGRLYLAVPKAEAAETAMAEADACRDLFAASGRLPDADDMEMPRRAGDETAAAAVLDFGTVGGTAASRHLILAYDDGFSIEYFYRKLRPYWRRTGWEARDLLAAAKKDYASLLERCRAFDADLEADMLKAGGEKYVFAASLAYRQSIAACKLAADIDGTPLFFPRENFSNGCISTVDVIYPAAPQYILLNPVLVRAMLVPVLDYAKSPQWPFPFAPHDLG
ncbi:MAG TPA: DUF5127 domain-containing protein, partial [Burkholderiales bacterium]|nr:DUF5127 domain-containing protein [Burkholderiales bacterium]